MSDSNRRARLLLWLRLVISVGLLAVLASKRPDLGDVVPSDHPGRTVTLLVLALLTALVGVGLSAWRWQRVLMVYDRHVPIGRLAQYTLVGLFVGNVLPSTIGGDVMRVSRVAADTGSGEIAFASIALERLTGFVVLPFLVACGFVVRPSLTNDREAWIALVVAGVTLGLLGTILFLAGHPKAAGRFKDHDNWLRFVGAVHQGVVRMRAQPRQAVRILAAALLYQIFYVASIVLIASAIELPAPVVALVAFVPAVAMVQVIPISLSGLGVREGMLNLLLHPLGVERGQAIGLGLMWYASLLVISVLGAPAFAAGKKARPAPIATPAGSTDA